MAYPTDITSDTPSAGTSLLSSPDHSARHNVNGSAITSLELKVGLGAGSPTLNRVLVGSGNGTTAWGTTVNSLNLGTPTIGSASMTGGTLTGGLFTGGTLTNVTGLTSGAPFITVGTANADYTTDGTADDVQIQAAIDAVGSAGGGIVYLKAGTYNISNNNTSPAFIQADTGSPYCGVILKDKVILKGAGPGHTVITYASFVGTALGQNMNPIVNSAGSQTFQGVTDLSIINPSFTVASGPYARSIHVKGVSNFLMQNLYLYRGGWAIFGSAVSWNNSTKELTTDTQYNLVDNVVVDTAKDSCMLFNIKNTTVRHSTFVTNYDDALLIAQSAHNILVEGNNFDGTNDSTGGATAHIYLTNDDTLTTDENALRDIKIVGNSIRRLITSSGFSGGIRILKAVGVKILNNFIDGNLGPGIFNGGEGILRDLVIQGNTIKSNGGYGIKLPANVGTSNPSIFSASITGNVIYNNTGFGIYFETASNTGTANGAVVSGNELFDNQGTITQTTGIGFHIAGTKNFTNAVLSMNNTHDMTTNYDFTVSSGSLTGGQLYINGGTLAFRGGAATLTPLGNP